MDKKQLTDLEHEAIKDAGSFAVVFGISFAFASQSGLAAGNLSDSKAVIVSAAIAGASEAVKKTKPMWAKLFTDTVAALQNKFSKPPPAPPDATTAAPTPTK